jgi:hypothetical protein
MIFEGTGNIRVHQKGSRVLISRKVRGEIEQSEVSIPSQHPLIGAGFYAYAVKGDNPSVVISSGALRIAFPQGFSEVDSSGEGVMPPMVVTNFAAGTSGYLVLRYAQNTGDALSMFVASSSLDFADPGVLYTINVTGNQETTGTESATIEDQDGVLRRYAVVFMTDPPVPTANVYQRVICRIEVDAAGQPTVYQVHIGDIQVPLGHSGFVTNIRSYSSS